MTTELEEHFFKVFGIEKECVKGCGGYYFTNGNIDAWNAYDCKNSDCSKCKHDKSIWKYPKITDRRLLKMICIFSQHCNFGRWNKYVMHSIDDFKYIMLSQLIEYQNKRYTYGIKEKIQQLFKEGE